MTEVSFGDCWISGTTFGLSSQSSTFGNIRKIRENPANLLQLVKTG